MLEEKFSNNWKDNLDALDRLPGEPWNKEVAWKRLEQRLEGKQRKRKMVWYWAAAACVILIISMQWINGIDKTDPVARQTINKTRVAQKATEMKEEVQVIIPTIKEQQSIAVIKKEKSRSAIKSTTLASNQSMPIDSVLADNASIQETPTVIPDTTETVVAEVRVLKPLPVVHINEIGKPVEEKTKLAHVRRLGSGGLNDNTFTNDYTPDDNILKIKLSPNN